MKNLSNDRVVWGQETVYDIPCQVPAWLGHRVPRDLVKYYFEYVWASLIAQLVKNPPGLQEALVQFLGWEDPLRRIGYPLQYSWASLVAQLVMNLPATRKTWVQSLGWEDPLEIGYPLQCSGLENSRDWVHGVTKGRTRLSDFQFHFSLSVPMKMCLDDIYIPMGRLSHAGASGFHPICGQPEQKLKAEWGRIDSLWLTVLELGHPSSLGLEGSPVSPACRLQ